MADKIIYFPNDARQNYPFCKLQLVVETFGHSTKQTNLSKFNKSPKSCLAKKDKIRKRYYKTLWISVINSPMSPPSLDIRMATFIETNELKATNKEFLK